jgi:hypothetical protein
MAEAWQGYVDQIVNKMDYNTNTYTITGICEAAAIYGQDGSAWAWTPTFPELTTYQFEIEAFDAGEANQTVTVNEFALAL